MADTFHSLLKRAEAREPAYSADEVAAWTPALLEQFLSAGLLRAAANADAVVCDACAGDHVEEVIYVESPLGSGLRGYIRCPEAGRVAVPLDRLRRWEVNVSGMAQLTAAALQTAGDVEEVIALRIWLLGKTTLDDRAHEIFFCRGLTWADGAEVIGRATRLQASPRPVVFVPGAVPALEIWAGNVPTVLPLSALTSWDGARLSIDRNLLEGAVVKRKKPNQPVAITPFPTPQGATWEDVRFLVTDLTIRVEVLGKRKELTFQEAGFEEKRRGSVPDRLWRLLRILAVHGGVLPASVSSLPEDLRRNLKQNVSQLGKRLAALLHIDGKPFRDTRRTHRYEARFKISAEEGLRFPTPEGLTWDGVSIAEVRPGVIAVRADAADAFGIYSPSDAEVGGAGRWEGAVQTGTLEREYELRSLGLADAEGQPTPAGEALLAVLRGDGKVQREKNDKAMLELGKHLSDLMQIDTSPFQFSLGQKKWSALFEASSAGPEAPGKK